MQVVGIAVAVAVLTVGTFAGIGPQRMLQTDCHRIDTGVDDTYNNRPAGLHPTGSQ